MNLPHDPFCRGVLSDVPTFLELVRYLVTVDAELNGIYNLLDQASFRRVPGDFSDTETTGYADLAFLADVKPEFLESAKPVQVCIGFLVEHKSTRDDGVLEQLRKYNFHLMVQQLKENAYKGLPSIAIIIYNGKENWNPLKNLYANCPKELQRLLLPFKCIMLDVGDISDEQLDDFNARLAAFIAALKYVRSPDENKIVFDKIMKRVQKEIPKVEALDLLLQMNVYLQGWLKENYKEAFDMDFIRPNYRTVGDVLREEAEAAKEAAREAGVQHQAEETARKMLAKNKPMEEIVEFSGLTEEQVRELQAKST